MLLVFESRKCTGKKLALANFSGPPLWDIMLEVMSETVKLYGINNLRETLVVAESTRKSMKSNRSQGTKPEIALRKALWAAGLRGYRKNVRSLPGTPDIVFNSHKVAIFVHGCFWHGHQCQKARLPKQNRAFWAEKLKRNAERHEKNQGMLEELGFTVLTAWECELQADREGWVNRIQECIVQHKSP